MSELIPVGPIVLLQIQKEKLIVGTGNGRFYDTRHLVEVRSLRVGRSGVIARIDGGWVLDRHHAAHPIEVNAHRPHRILSIGFGGHYRLIEKELGWAPLGTAGENIIVDTDARLELGDVARGFVIRTAGGDLPLDPPLILNPCVPFTKHLLRDEHSPTQAVVEAQSSLTSGMRGYSMNTSQVPDYATVQVGDMVLRRAVS